MKISEQILECINAYYEKNNVDISVLADSDKINLSFDICSFVVDNLLIKLLDDVYLDFNGHFNLDNCYFKELSKSHLNYLIDDIKSDGFSFLSMSIYQYLLKNDLTIFDHIDQDKEFIIAKNENCFCCGKKLSLNVNLKSKKMHYSFFNGKSMVKDEGCSEKDKKGVFSFTHNFPSGKIIFANDLRDIYPDYKEKDREISSKIKELSGYYNTINSNLGQELNTKLYSDTGLVYIQVGNTSPNIFKDNSGLIIAKPETLYDPKTDEEWDNFNENEKNLGSICTDLWAVCAMDYDLYKSLKIEKAKKDYPDEKIDETYINEDDFDFIVEVKPGTYKITSYYNSTEEQKDEKFFTMELL